jgi:hypothetical protein
MHTCIHTHTHKPMHTLTHTHARIHIHTHAQVHALHHAGLAAAAVLDHCGYGVRWPFQLGARVRARQSVAE